MALSLVARVCVYQIIRGTLSIAAIVVFRKG